ncbi:unnamed protein product, partial [Laminaria digitata]
HHSSSTRSNSAGGSGLLWWWCVEPSLSLNVVYTKREYYVLPVLRAAAPAIACEGSRRARASPPLGPRSPSSSGRQDTGGTQQQPTYIPFLVYVRTHREKLRRAGIFERDS